MSFSEFVESAGKSLADVQGRLGDRHETHEEGGPWWICFNRAPCLYRISFDPRASALILERGQGSFVPSSDSTWRLLESRPVADASFDTALAVLGDILKRFHPPS